jgi:hypothetical protein
MFVYSSVPGGWSAAGFLLAQKIINGNDGICARAYDGKKEKNEGEMRHRKSRGGGLTLGEASLRKKE